MASDVVLEQRCIIKFFVKLNEKCNKILENLIKVYGDHVMSKTQVYDWYNQFKNGRENIFSEHNIKPRTSTDDTNIIIVQEIINEDRGQSLSEIAAITGINRMSIHQILTQHLGLSWCGAKWVPKLLDPKHKQIRMDITLKCLERYRKEGDNFLNRIITMDETLVRFYEPKTNRESGIWKHGNSPVPKKPRISPSDGYQMLVVFFDYKGFVYHHYVPKNKTINGQYFKEICRQMIYQVKKKRPDLFEKGIILHMDNAPPHRAYVVKELMANHNIELLPHPPYSPDTAPSDFFVFPRLKKDLRGHRFSCENELQKFCDGSLRTMAKNGLKDAFLSLVKRWGKLINVEGEYFEHDKNLCNN